MENIKVEISFHQNRWIEKFNNASWNETEIMHFIGFPFQIWINSESVEMMIIPSYSIDIKADDNEVLKKKLYVNAVKNLKNIFLERKNIVVFNAIKYYPEKIEIENELEVEFDTFTEFAIEINQELYKSFSTQFKEYHLISDRFRTVKNFLFEMTQSQIDYNKELVRSCFNYLFDCLKSSDTPSNRISDLESIFKCFLFDKKNFDYFKRQLYSFHPPKLYESKPNLPQEMDEVF